MIPNNLESTNLNENQLIAAQLMASGMTGREIANELNITPETISRWRHMPKFREYLDKLLANFSGIAAQRMIALSLKALNAIEQIFDDPDASSKDRFIAGMKILELCEIKSIVSKTIRSACELNNKEISEILARLSNEQLQDIVDGKKMLEDFI